MPESLKPADDIADRVRRKVARRIVPFLGVLYFINYVDRTNIGFAKLEMSEDLGLSGTTYGLAAGLFFIGYLLFEVPSNLALHKVGARRWIARIMLTWGAVASATAFVGDATQLYVLRVLLGIAEAGFFPGVLLYLTYWIPRRERARITGLFLTSAAVSSAIGAPISAALMQYGDGLFGLEGWRVMFLLEGLPAVAAAFVCWFFLTDRPAEARWLTDGERSWLTSTMDREDADRSRRYHWPIRRSLTDPRVWGLAFGFFGITYGGYTLSFFLPTIVDGFSEMFDTSFSLVQTSLIVAVPYAAAIVVMVWWTKHSDRRSERVWHVALPAAIGSVSIPVALYLGSPIAVMVAITITAASVFAAMPVFLSMPGEFLVGAGAAAGLALINSLGNLSGFFAPYVTGVLSDVTGSEKAGLWVAGVCLLLSAVVIVALGVTPRPDIAEDVTRRETG